MYPVLGHNDGHHYSIYVMPEGWAASAGGFPAMTGNVPFLMKDVVLLAVSVYLLKQDVVRALLAARHKMTTQRP